MKLDGGGYKIWNFEQKKCKRIVPKFEYINHASQVFRENEIDMNQATQVFREVD